MILVFILGMLWELQMKNAERAKVSLDLHFTGQEMELGKGGVTWDESQSWDCNTVLLTPSSVAYTLAYLLLQYNFKTAAFEDSLVQ